MSSRIEVSSKTYLDLKNHDKLVIGIDLGTTFSCVGAYRSKKIEIVTNDIGGRVTPSLVSFKNDEILIGNAAKNIMNQNAENTIKDSKRLIGRKFKDKIVQEDIKNWLFTVEENPENGFPQYVINQNDEEKRYYPEEISSMILKKLRGFAEEFLGTEIHNAVITVPAYFNNSQREATKKAGVMAGFKNIRILNEPTAAAIAYGFQNKNDKEKIVLVFDLGGGTFDVSIVKINNKNYEVLAINGDNHLGGEDFNNLLIDYIVNDFYESDGIDLRINKKAMKRIVKCVEEAKIDLSTLNEVTIDQDGICEGADLYMVISRPTYEEQCQELWNKCIKIMEKTISDANLTKEQIDDVVLAGGSSRTPKIQEMIADFFDGRKPYKSINPDEAIAYGATIFGISELYQDKGYNNQKNINMNNNNIKMPRQLLVQNNNNIPMRKMQKEDNKIPQINNNNEESIKYKKGNYNEIDFDDDENSEKYNENNRKNNIQNFDDENSENHNENNKKNNEDYYNTNQLIEASDDEDDDDIEKHKKKEKNYKIDNIDDEHDEKKEEDEDEKKNNQEIEEIEDVQNDNKSNNNNLLAEASDDENDDEFRNLIINDGTPLTIGIGVAGGTMIKIIPKLTRLPKHNEKKIFKKTFTPYKDYQTSYNVRIYEGENELIKDNFLLGEFTVTGFEPKKRGEIIIEIVFYLDHDSILTVKARQNDEIKQELIIKNRDQYSKEELEKMKKHAIEFELHEKQRKKIQEIIKKMENIISDIKKNNDDDEIRNKVSEIEKWINYHAKSPLEHFESKLKELLELKNNI